MYQCFDAHKSATGESCLQIPLITWERIFIAPEPPGLFIVIARVYFIQLSLERIHPPPHPPHSVCLLGTRLPLSLSLSPILLLFLSSPFLCTTQILIEPRYLFMSVSKGQKFL